MKHLQDFNLFEGKTHEATKKSHSKKAGTPDKKEEFRSKIKTHVESQYMKTKEVGNDLEVLCDGEMIAQVMFRNQFVGVKKKGVKFVDEFEYTELGKIKSKITQIIKDCKK